MTTDPKRETLAAEVKRLADNYANACVYVAGSSNDSQHKAPYLAALHAAIDALAAAAQQREPAATPPGYKLVPVNPTTEMMRAAMKAYQAGGITADLYRAMLRAAPAQKPAEPAAPSEALALRDIAFCQRVLNWNRAQENPPIRIGSEYAVAQAAISFASPARLQHGSEKK